MATYTLTGPSTGVQQVASTNFTVTADATAITGSVVVTPSDGGKGGTFTPTTVSLTAANQAKTFTYTPQKTGTVTISTTSTQSYVNPAALTYTVTLNKDVAINQILMAQFKNRGTRFPFDEIVRDGGMSSADAITLRTSFDTYVTAQSNRPALTPAHADKASQIHQTTTLGRVGRGGGNVNEDKASTIHETTQTGRSGPGTTNDQSTNKETSATGR